MSVKDRLIPVACLVLSPLVLAVCDDGPTDTESTPEGFVTAAVHDSMAVLPSARTALPPADSMTYTGHFNGSTLIEIYSDSDGFWTTLGSSTQARFAIFCTESAVPFSNVGVPVGTYSRVRLTLQGFVADVEAGAIIAHQTYANALTVAVGTSGTSVVIEKSVTPFQVTAGGTTTIDFDLNSEMWLTDAVVAAGAVDAAAVQAATQVRLR